MFEVWINNNILIGHLQGYTELEAEEYKLEYAKKVWDENTQKEEVSLCEV